MKVMIEILRACKGDSGEILKAGDVVEVQATLAGSLVGSNKAVPVEGSGVLDVAPHEDVDEDGEES